MIAALTMSTTFRYVLVGLLAIGILSTGVSLATQALFTETQAVGSNTFSTGTIDIATSPATALLTISVGAPGSKVTNPLTATNAGTLDLRYAITTDVTSNDASGLVSKLDATIKTGVTTCDNTNFSVDGSIVNSGPVTFGGATTTNIMGDPTTGADTDDRTLTAGSSEVLCFQVEFPATETGPQGASETVTLNFVSEQTLNNP